MTGASRTTTMRSHVTGALGEATAGERVALCGWIHRRRDHGGLVFLDLRDRYGMVQCVADPDRIGATGFDLVERLRLEDVVRVEGEVRDRPPANVNPDLATGSIEVAIDAIERLAVAATPPFPIDVDKEGGEVDEELRLRHRYLELRRPRAAAALGMRHRIALETRKLLDGEGFWEVETPMLTRRTPEGARDYLVPSRIHPGAFYALPQSPQLYKQLLMVAGFDRYFQIARCFRDEDLRADRQPEFTQIDVEMAFVDREDVIGVMDRLFRHLFRSCLDIELGEIPRLGHDEALAAYGTDKPDLRFEHRLVDVTDDLRETGFRVFDDVVGAGGRIIGLRVPGGADASRGTIDRWSEAARSAGAKGLVWARREADGWTSSVDKFVDADRWAAVGARLEATAGDLALVVADRPRAAQRALGQLRLRLAEERAWIPGATWSLAWVVDFPLFDLEDGRPVPSHHPFTAPVGGLDALETADVATIPSAAYDLVLNGFELGSGSIRIHDRAVQERVFELLGVSAEEARARFGFLLRALEHGAPPHGGIAIGLDRTAMLFAGADSLREVVAFPKTTSASGLMEGAPSPISAAELAELHIRLAEGVDSLTSSDAPG